MNWIPRRTWTDAHWSIIEKASSPASGTRVALQHDRLAWPLLAREGRRILLGGDADLFDEQVPLEFVASVFGVMALARQHIFQILTRHPQRLKLFLAWLDRHNGWLPMRACHASLCKAALERSGIDIAPFANPGPMAWPLPNVWLGLRASNEDELRTGLPRLLLAAATLRWLMLERPTAPIDLTRLQVRHHAIDAFAYDTLADDRQAEQATLNALTGCVRHGTGAFVTSLSRLDWVVVDARDNAGMVQVLKGQCKRANVPLYCSGTRDSSARVHEVPRATHCAPTERRHGHDNRAGAAASAAGQARLAPA